ncbi:MAG TPA: WD40 repeat domain-containing protein [Candidatus Limnocylindrales bacterium]|nr:WD40 repeat domain-containing protein [Candidatus Limnocylindrales bacterium]
MNDDDFIAMLSSVDDRRLVSPVFSRSRRTIAFQQDQTLKLWNASDGKPIATLDAERFLKFFGDRIVTEGTGFVRLRDATTGRIVEEWQDIRPGPRLWGGNVIPLRSQDGTVWILDLVTGGRIGHLGHLDAQARLVLGRDGLTAVVMHDGQPPQVWSTVTGTKIVTLSRFGNDAKVRFAPNGHILMVIDDRLPYLVEADTGQLIGILDRLDSTGHPAQFSPDGQVVATVGPDRMTRLWQTSTGRLVAILAYGGDTVFSPDSKTVATAPPDGPVRLWDVGQLRSTEKILRRAAPARTEPSHPPLVLETQAIAARSLAWSFSRCGFRFETWQATFGQRRPSEKVRSRSSSRRSSARISPSSPSPW